MPRRGAYKGLRPLTRYENLILQEPYHLLEEDYFKFVRNCIPRGAIMIGKKIRLQRIIDRNTGKSIIVPMDHGVTVGPIPGLIDIAVAVNKVANGGANAILMHKGLVETGHRSSGKDIGLIVHLSASTILAPDSNAKTVVCTVEEAVRLGAGGVSIHNKIGAQK